LRRKPDGSGPKRWWPVSILVAVSLAGAGWWVTISPVFSARHVEITGRVHLSRADVVRLAGIGPGTNLFWFHPAAAEAGLERSRWVAAATVTRSLPSTLRIAIRERSPVAQVKENGRYLIVAADGTVLERSAVAGGLPLLAMDPTAGGVLREVGRSAWVVAAMSPWLRSRVTNVLRAADGTIVVHLASGIPVYYGDATDVLQKDEALAAVLHWALAGGHPLESIDLQAPLAPTARLNVYVPSLVVPVTASPTPSASPSGSPSPSPSASTGPALSKDMQRAVDRMTGRGKGKHRHHARHH
jgi:cell division protein FtsQ